MIIHASAALLLLGAAACGGGERAAAPDGSGTFRATAVTEDGRPREIVAGSEIQLVLQDGVITARAGCNDMSGRASVGERLVVSDLVTTDKFCGEELARQEAWLAGFLKEGPSWQRTGDELVLRGATAEIRLAA